MNIILIKMFATALALSQVTTKPDAVKTVFDPVADQGVVVQLLKDGCAHMRKAFDIEDLKLDDLIETALSDPQAVTGEIKAFRGINFDDLHSAYKEFCTNETIANSPFDLKEVIEFYNHAVADLPDHTRLKGLKLPGTSVVLDGKGERFAELFESDHRRVWVPLTSIPKYVQQSFVAAEDKRFYQHHGIDERGLIRAFISNIAQPGRPQGGSTITQQVAKNLLVGDDVSYERKIREMIEASRIDSFLTKDETLEVYLNSIYLGRGAWGIDMAARTYFKKPASALSVTEGALLASLAKGPSYFSPDRFPQRSRERFSYVLKRMQEDQIPEAVALSDAATVMPHVLPYDKPRREAGFHFVEHLLREAKNKVGMQSLTVESYTVRSTINAKLQRAAETALQDGLARYETQSGRAEFDGPELNLGESVARVDSDMLTHAQRRGRINRPVWQMALMNAKLPLYDVHWPTAIVLEKRAGENGQISFKVGLRDGRIMPLVLPESIEGRKLKLNDVIYVAVNEGTGKKPEAKAELRVRPKVQGATIVLENKTGRILAMVGGFSYPQSQLNRTTQALRQPGSSIKPLTYLTALHKGLQPNTLVQDAPVTLPPIPGVTTHSWTPKNYEGGGQGTMTLRRALENSKNMVTARLLDGGIDKNPSASLDQICEIAMQARIYKDCIKNYPFVLGAQGLYMINLAGFYASMANEGLQVSPYAIDSIEQSGKPVYRHTTPPAVWLDNGDRVAFYQLRTILEGVVARGTAASMRDLAGFVAGKTGTTENENDAWFAGITADCTVIVWVGYDNTTVKRTLGRGETGGRVSVPIARQIIEATWQFQAPKTPLPAPSAEAARRLKALPIDLNSGMRVASGTPGAFTEYFRLDASNRIRETQYALTDRRHVAARIDPRENGSDDRVLLYPGGSQRQGPPSRPPRTLRELLGL